MTAPLSSILRPESVASSLENLSAPSLSPVNCSMDGHVGGFRDQVADWRSLAAMTAGGLAYRSARIGVMGLGNGSLLRTVSVGVGLTAEVSTFEFTHHGLTNPHNLHWNGPGGIRQGLLPSFISFGTLRGAGHLAQGEGLIVQHLFQDSAMVLGHQMTGALRITPRPTGCLAEQFLHAEATHLHWGAGMALGHGLLPGLHALGRGLDLSLPPPPVGALGEAPPWRARFAFPGIGGEGFSVPEPGSAHETLLGPQTLAMRNHGDGAERSEAGLYLLRRWFSHLESRELEDSAVVELQDFLELKAFGLEISHQVEAVRRLVNRHFPPSLRVTALADLATDLARNGHLVEAHRLLEEEDLNLKEADPDLPELWSSEEGMARVHMISSLAENEIFEGEINPVYHLARIRDPQSRFMAWGVLLHALVDSGQTRRARALLASFERVKNSVATPPEVAPMLRRMLREIIRERNRMDNGGTGGIVTILLALGGSLASFFTPDLAHASVGFSEATGGGAAWVGLSLSALAVLGTVLKGRNSSGPPLQLSLGSGAEHAARELWRRYTERVVQEGLPSGHRNVLDRLARQGPTSIFRLGRETRHSFAVGELSPALREMEELGLISTFRNGPEDFYQLTEKGRSVERIYRPFEAWMPLPQLTRPVIRRLESGHWTLEKSLGGDFKDTPPAEISRRLELICERGYLERRRHREFYRGFEYRLSQQGRGFLEGERRREAQLRNVAQNKVPR